MRSSLVLLSVTLCLVACASNPSPSTPPSPSSSIARSEASMADGAFSGSIIPSLLSLRTAFPETVFTDPSRVIYKDRISLSEKMTLPAKTVQGYAMVTKDGHLENDRMTTVAEWAKKNGWTSSPLLDADGATGSIWGYTKEMKEGTQVLIIQSHLLCNNAPTDCEKEHREVVFVSDPLKK